jgi:periplasmic protein TonB
MAIGSSAAFAQRGETGSLPEVMNSARMGIQDLPVTVSGRVMAGLIVHKVDPIYPKDAKANGISGPVVMTATIDDHGKVAKLSVVSGPEVLRAAALTAVRQWTYKPFQLNGAPVVVSTVVTVHFSQTQ